MKLLKVFIILRINTWANLLPYENFNRAFRKAFLHPSVQDNICKRGEWAFLASSPFKFEQPAIDLFFLDYDRSIEYELRLKCAKTLEGLSELKEIWVTCANYSGSNEKYFNKYLVKPSFNLAENQISLDTVENQVCQSPVKTYVDFGVISADVWYLVGWQRPNLQNKFNMACVIFRSSPLYDESLIDEISAEVVNKINEDYFPEVTDDNEIFAKFYCMTSNPNNECKESPYIDYHRFQCMKEAKTLEEPQVNLSVIFGCSFLILWLVVIGEVIGIKYCWKDNRVSPTNKTTA